MKIRAMALVSTILVPFAASTAVAAEPQRVPATSAAHQDIVVTAPRRQDEAREQQKNAPNIVNVQSAEAIDKYPDFNAAEPLSRIPGISLSSDTGEGRFVNIRGIDAADLQSPASILNQKINPEGIPLESVKCHPALIIGSTSRYRNEPSDGARTQL